MQVYVEGQSLLIDVSESFNEESLDVYIVDHGKKQRIEGQITISPQRKLKLRVDRRIHDMPIKF